MKKNHFSVSVCVPVYKGSPVLKNALRSILNQRFTDYELIIGDDNPKELTDEIAKTQEIIKSLRDPRIRYFKNPDNIGTQPNIRKLGEMAKNDIVFYLAQDDILAKDALQKTHDAFLMANDVGFVTRPYFWYETDINKPVRAVPPPDPNKNTIFSIDDGEKAVTAIFGSIGQVSGLAYMRKYREISVHNDIFPGHIYPFAGIFKKYRCVFLKDYTIAVGILDSQCRHISTIYDTSPTEQWVKMFKTVYAGKKFKKTRELGIKHITSHFAGLVQLKSYGKKGVLEREIKVLLKYRPQNILRPTFWFYSFLTLLLPPKLLIFMTDVCKREILAKKLPPIQFLSDYV